LRQLNCVEKNHEVLRLLVDGRSSKSGVLNQKPQLAVCLRFLWLKYHFDAEGMPDKWHFDAAGHSIKASGHKVKLPRRTEQEDSKDEELRAIATAAMHAVLADAPTLISAVGPNAQPGPRRYIGVMKPVQLYLMFQIWFKARGIESTVENKTPSFCTFLRALGSARPWLKFRKSAGQHANCDNCVRYKMELRKLQGPSQRALLLEEYNSHLLDQWLDREIDMNLASISIECAQALWSGQLFGSLSKRLSSFVLRVDGVDQAKFRVPRVALKSHAFEKLLRPALHIQGAWCHGFGFHFAVADADSRKDTNNNIEAQSFGSLVRLVLLFSECVIELLYICIYMYIYIIQPEHLRCLCDYS
jgi:hypothetical protein